MSIALVPEGYTPVLPGWPVGVQPWGEMSQKLFSEEDITHGNAIYLRGVDALAAEYNRGGGYVEMWRRLWDDIPEFSADAARADIAHYTAAAFEWFGGEDEIREFGAFLTDSGYRAASSGSSYQMDQPIEPVRAMALTLRSGVGPDRFRTAIQEYGPKSVHRATAALRRGSLRTLMEVEFPVQYVAEFPVRWTTSLDVIAKCAYGGMPRRMMEIFLAQKVSAVEADFLCTQVAPEYIDLLFG